MITHIHALISGLTTLTQPMINWHYRGNTFLCPVCHGHFRAFKPYGAKLELSNHYKLISLGYRQNALCPGCGSKERERAIALFMARHMIWPRRAPRSVLHIAPEHALGVYLSRLTEPHYLSGDLVPSRSPRPAMRQMDITRIPCPENSFDILICNHVLEHIEDDMKALQEIYRVLNPGGFAILQIPYAHNLNDTIETVYTRPEDRLRHYGQEDHVRLYGMDYSLRIRTCGFHLEDDSMYQRFGLDRVSQSGLIADEKLFVAYKPV